MKMSNAKCWNSLLLCFWPTLFPFLFQTEKKHKSKVWRIVGQCGNKRVHILMHLGKCMWDKAFFPWLNAEYFACKISSIFDFYTSVVYSSLCAINKMNKHYSPFALLRAVHIASITSLRHLFCLCALAAYLYTCIYVHQHTPDMRGFKMGTAKIHCLSTMTEYKQKQHKPGKFNPSSNNKLYRPFQMQAWSCITSYTLQGLPYLAYDNVNPTMVNSMMLRSSMLAFEKVYKVCCYSNHSPLMSVYRYMHGTI